MLRTNLATRPFYNQRAVQVTVGGLALVVALLTIGNAVQFARLRASERDLGARAEQAEAEAGRLREQARGIRAKIDTKELAEVAAAAKEANAIIDLRAFSWSDLFAHLESTLPQSVRLTSFQPHDDKDGNFVVSIRVQARRVQDLEGFLDAMEKTGVFHNVLAAEEQADPDGLINALVEGAYVQPVPTGAAPGGQPKGAAGE